MRRMQTERGNKKLFPAVCFSIPFCNAESTEKDAVTKTGEAKPCASRRRGEPQRMRVEISAEIRVTGL